MSRKLTRRDKQRLNRLRHTQVEHSSGLSIQPTSPTLDTPRATPRPASPRPTPPPTSLAALFGYDLSLIYGDLQRTLFVTSSIVILLTLLWWFTP